MLLTPTERKLRDRLADGQPHTFDELFSLLDDNLSDRSNLRKHLANLRSKLSHLNLTISYADKSYQLTHLPTGPITFVS